MQSKNFIWIVGLFAATYVTGKKIKIGKMNITYGSFIPLANKRLNGTILSTEPAETMSQCVRKCEDHKNCQSANFEAKQCELLSDNQHESKTNLKTLSGSIHLAKMSRGCDKNNCHNNATCGPDYENNTFSCNCKPEYTGKFCEVMLQSPIPDWWFKFDGGTENDGLKPNDASFTPLYTDKGKAIFTGQPHRKGRYLECHFKCTESIVSWPGWSDLEHNEISFAFWVKIDHADILYQDNFNNGAHVFETFGYGLKTFYWKPTKKWAFEVYITDGVYYVSIPFAIEETKKWNFLAMSWRNGRLSGFVNDVEVTETGIVTISRRQGDIMQLFDPYQRSILNIDDFRVWYHAKSPDFMKELYYNESVDMWH